MQLGALTAVVLAGLARLGPNAVLARRLLAALAAQVRGRTALRIGAARWQAQATRQPPVSESASHSALQWAVQRLWQLGKPWRLPYVSALWLPL